MPSMGTHALSLTRFLNMRLRSTKRSRTTGNLDMGSSVMTSSWPHSLWMLSTSAEHAWRTVPLMIMVQAPQISSRQLQSQTTGVMLSLPEAFAGSAAISCSEEMMFMFGLYGIAYSSQ